MTASGGFYPSLGRYFRSMTELAHAGVMSTRRLRDCLDGKKDFTRAEKKAISSNIAMKLMDQPSFDYQELQDAHTAWKGKFDEIYRRKGNIEDERT